MMGNWFLVFRLDVYKMLKFFTKSINSSPLEYGLFGMDNLVATVDSIDVIPVDVVDGEDMCEIELSCCACETILLSNSSIFCLNLSNSSSLLIESVSL